MRAPWATVEDTSKLSDVLDSVVINNHKIISVGNFNIPGVQWSSSSTVKHSPGGSLYNFATAHDLIQLAQ